MSKVTVEVGKWSDKDAQPDSNAKGTDADQTALSALDALAWLLDSSIQLPGTKLRIGLDSVIGLIPILGDAIGALLSSYILFMAAKMGVPRVTLLRMGLNATLDSVLGLVPFAGDLFDAAFKSNLRNVKILRAHIENPTRARRGDWFFAGLFILGILGVLGLLGWAAYALQVAVVRNFFA